MSGRLTHLDEHGRARMVDVVAASAATTPDRPRAGAAAHVAGHGGGGPRRLGPEGRGARRRAAGRRPGRQADAAADPARAPAAAQLRGRRGARRGRRGAGGADRGGADDRGHGRRDGGDDGRRGRRAHRLRHGQGRRARGRDRAGGAAREAAAGAATTGSRTGAASAQDGAGRLRPGELHGAAVVTVSHLEGGRATGRTRAGRGSRRSPSGSGWRSSRRRSCPTTAAQLEALLRSLADERCCALVLTSGGTGVAPSDVTPEATLAVVDCRGRRARRGDADRLAAPHGQLDALASARRCARRGP